MGALLRVFGREGDIYQPFKKIFFISWSSTAPVSGIGVLAGLHCRPVHVCMHLNTTSLLEKAAVALSAREEMTLTVCLNYAPSRTGASQSKISLGVGEIQR